MHTLLYVLHAHVYIYLSLSLTHTFFLSLSLTHIHTFFLSLTHTHTYFLFFFLSLSLTHTHIHFLSHTLSLSQMHTHILSLSLTHTLSLSLSLTHTHKHTRTHTQTPLLTHKFIHLIVRYQPLTDDFAFLEPNEQHTHIIIKFDDVTRFKSHFKFFILLQLFVVSPSCNHVCNVISTAQMVQSGTYKYTTQKLFFLIERNSEHKRSHNFGLVLQK